MRRRSYLAGVTSLTGLVAGCQELSLSTPEPPDDLWSVSVGSVEMEVVALDVDIVRGFATTEQSPVIRLTFHNPLSEMIVNLHEGCPKSPNDFILFPVGMDPEPIRPDCRKPDPESFIWPCEATIANTYIDPGKYWSVDYEIWIDDEGPCIPVGNYEIPVNGTYPAFMGGVGGPDYPDYEQSDQSDIHGSFVLSIESETR